MAKIIKILKNQTKYYDDYCIVYVQTDDGSEASIYVGGQVELFFSKGQIKAHVKRAQSRGKLDTKRDL